MSYPTAPTKQVGESSLERGDFQTLPSLPKLSLILRDACHPMHCIGTKSGALISVNCRTPKLTLALGQHLEGEKLLMHWKQKRC